MVYKINKFIIMQNLIAVILLLLTAAQLSAQHTGAHKEKMKPFKMWAGKWQGESQSQNAQGQTFKAKVDESIQWKLDDTILLIEGIGKVSKGPGEEMVVHHAMGVLSYDQRSDAYRFNTYLSDGRSTDAWFRIVSENSFQWGFETPHAKMKYNITLDNAAGTWHETGEYSADGAIWKKVIEMTLRKVQ